MKGLLKNLGLILVVIGAVILVACSFTGNVNNNAILGSSAVLVVVKRKEIKKAVSIYMQTAFFIFSPSEEPSLIKTQLPE